MNYVSNRGLPCPLFWRVAMSDFFTFREVILALAIVCALTWYVIDHQYIYFVLESVSGFW